MAAQLNQPGRRGHGSSVETDLEMVTKVQKVIKVTKVMKEVKVMKVTGADMAATCC